MWFKFETTVTDGYVTIETCDLDLLDDAAASHEAARALADLARDHLLGGRSGSLSIIVRRPDDYVVCTSLMTISRSG